MIDSADTVLPEPDSPTSATVSPLFTSNETPLTARFVVSPDRNATERSRTWTRGAPVFILTSPECLARIERVAHGLADEDEQAQQDCEREEGGEPKPRCLQVGLALRQELTERGRTRRQAQPEEVERSQRGDAAREIEGQERQHRHHGIRQQVLEHDLAVG